MAAAAARMGGATRPLRPDKRVSEVCMAGKRSAKNSLKESISLSVKAQQYFGYSDYFNRIPLFTMLQVSNSGAESAEEIDVVIECVGGFLLPFPFRSGRAGYPQALHLFGSLH